MQALEAARLLEQGDALAVDVREPREWQAGRIAGAILIPMSELGRRYGELPRDRPLVAVCRSGNRSAVVTRALRDAGYAIENLDGGLKAWQRAGLPLDPPDGRVV